LERGPRPETIEIPRRWLRDR